MGLQRMIALSVLLAAGTIGSAVAQDQSDQGTMGTMKPGTVVTMPCNQTDANCMGAAVLPGEIGGKNNTAPSAGASEGTSAGATEGARPADTQGGLNARAAAGADTSRASP